MEGSSSTRYANCRILFRTKDAVHPKMDRPRLLLFCKDCILDWMSLRSRHDDSDIFLRIRRLWPRILWKGFAPVYFGNLYWSIHNHAVGLHALRVSFAKQIAYEHLLSGAKNPLLIGHRVFFYLTAIFTPFVIGCMSNPWPVLALNLAFYGTFLSGYIGQALCSCTPLPPGKSKLRQALDAGRVWLESITAPDHPMPEPVGT